MRIVAVDIGGTNARFALADVADGRVERLGPATTLATGEHASLQRAWSAFGERNGEPLPRAAAIAFAGPVAGETLKLTNSPWVLRPAELARELDLDAHVLINDFGAVAHAVAQVGPEHLVHVCGPDVPLPAAGVVSIVGPGTGLGVAQLIRRADGYEAIETEGGHIDFAPLDAIDDMILAHLRPRFLRVSAERIVSGPGLANILGALTAQEGRPAPTGDDAALWATALSGGDGLAAAALERFCLALGSIAGDLALAQGAQGVALAGGVGLRLAAYLPQSGFAARFIAKGRFERRMAAMPVRLIAHPQPGLYGAAAAFAIAYAR